MYLRHLLRRRHPLFLTPLLTTTTTSTTVTTTSTTFFSLPNLPKPFHSTAPLSTTAVATTAAKTAVESDDDEDTAAMNEFLSRFVHSMRFKLTEAYPTSDKHTIDSMLIIVVDKLVAQMNNYGGSFENISAIDEIDNEDLSKTMWEVSNTVFHEMEREKKKEKLNYYLQSEEVKTMARFASEVGVRGDMLREMRFKWAKEVMEEAEFYDELKELKEEAEKADKESECGDVAEGEIVENENENENENESESESERREGLPKRRGKIKYKLYGLDLSGEKWREVAEKVQAAEEVVWPSEAKAITGKCKVVTEKILGLGVNYEEGYVSELLKEWMELLEPSRVDWIVLLDNVKARDYDVYLKVDSRIVLWKFVLLIVDSSVADGWQLMFLRVMAERVLEEPTFQPDIRDYSLLIDAHAKENRTEDVDRLLKKMSEKGLTPDVLILTTLLHLYSKANKLDQAKEAYEALRTQGLKPDMKMYNSMLTAYMNAGQLKSAEALIREMEVRDVKSSEDIYMSLLQAFADRGDTNGAQRIVTTMRFSGFQPTAKSCTLLIQACAKSGNPTEARKNFEYMMNLGFKPDDKSTSMLISAYEKRNELDKALGLLVQLEKDGFEPGISTYCVLVDWLGKLQLIDEAEQMLTKISQLGEAPPLKLQVSLCDMYAKAGIEKKALQALGVLEGKKDLLEQEDFERIIQGLLHGGFENDGRRIKKLMEAQGFTASEFLTIRLMATESFRGSGINNRPRMR
ncbi:hypothetical protein KSS87_023697 [Heliosperma pusillum]|nr:hypothetical protein KSS87_023697 [Heliosperma pusillum]